MNEKQIDEFCDIFGEDLSHHIQMALNLTQITPTMLMTRRQKTIDFLQKPNKFGQEMYLRSILFLALALYKDFDLDSTDAIRKVKLFMQQAEALV